MIATPQDLRMLVSELSSAAWTLAILGVLFESGLADELAEPRSIEELSTKVVSLPVSRIRTCLDVAAAVGVVVVDGSKYRLADGAKLPPPMRMSVVGDIRSQVMLPHAFLDTARAAVPTTGWHHTDPVLLQAQGDASTALAGGLKMMIAPQLGDLATRLEQPSARMLDVGTGVGALAICICRTFPQVSVVGLDTREEPLAVARSNVERSKLGDRIELRKLPVEELRDEAAYDIAWVPQFFIAAAAHPKAFARVHASLRPGGWVLVPILGVTGDARSRAVGALVSELWGGPVTSIAEIEALLQRTGFTSVRALPGPLAMVVAQRA